MVDHITRDLRIEWNSRVNPMDWELLIRELWQTIGVNVWEWPWDLFSGFYLPFSVSGKPCLLLFV